MTVLDGAMQDDPRNMLVDVELTSFFPKTEEEREVSAGVMLDPLNEEDLRYEDLEVSSLEFSFQNSIADFELLSLNIIFMEWNLESLRW